MTEAAYQAGDYDVYVGNDVDKRSFSLTVRDRYRTLLQKKMPAEPEQLSRFIENQFRGQRVIVGYEAGPTGFGLYDYLRSCRQDCVLISPSSVPRTTGQRVKTNRIDSAKLAVMLCDGEFKPIRVPEGPYRELRHLVVLRENYVQDLRMLKQRIKSLLLYVGLNNALRDVEGSWSRRYLKNLRELECSAAVRLRLDMLLGDLEHARERLLNILRSLKAFCEENPEVEKNIVYLRSIPGIGFVTACSLLGRIGDPKNLKSLRELPAFIGIVPREHSTGDHIRRGSITHLGNGRLRSLLVEAAWVAIKYDKELNQFYHRIKNRHHSSFGSRKAIVAVAHKLTLRIYRVLKEQRKYIVR